MGLRNERTGMAIQEEQSIFKKRKHGYEWTDGLLILLDKEII